MYYLKHAWDATHSVWGKACIVLFYLFIWLQIVWAVQLVIAPTFGWECYYDGLSDYAEAFVVKCMRGMNIITVGFFLYADRGGIKVWNVGMVFIVTLAYTLAITSGGGVVLDGAPEDCSFDSAAAMFWGLFWWSALALLLSFLEHRAAAGTSGERTPLVG